jgi:Putative transmembrane protein (PGPGW)
MPAQQPGGRRRAPGEAWRRIFLTIAGGAVCLVGIALLVLPGPGLLVVLGGLMLLAAEHPWARRPLAPLRRRALRAAEHSVSSPARLAGSVVTAMAPIAAGITWLLVPALPCAGAATGTTLILSGIVPLALLAYSHRRFRRNHTSPSPSHPVASDGERDKLRKQAPSAVDLGVGAGGPDRGQRSSAARTCE